MYTYKKIAHWIAVFHTSEPFICFEDPIIDEVAKIMLSIDFAFIHVPQELVCLVHI